MADSDRDQELMRASAQHAQRQALQHISDEAQNVANTYAQQIARGDSDGAAWTLRQYASLAAEAQVIAGQQQQQAQPQQRQQQQPQPQYTQAEQDLMQHYPQIVNDPKKWATAQAAANNLISRGYDRNSGEYISAIAHACDVLNSDLTESNEVASPNEALRACQSKYGSVSADEYNENAKRLAELKKYGLYPMSQ
jgi:hypothetical protein